MEKDLLGDRTCTVRLFGHTVDMLLKNALAIYITIA